MKIPQLRSENTIGLRLYLATCLVLIILNGFENFIYFKIDEITIALLVLCFLPFLQKILSSLKAGGIEVQFRDYSVHEQIFIFLDGIASKQTWTFFTPREGEVSLGQGFKVLIDELLQKKREELIEQVKVWLKSNNDNHKWFAAEVIGYGKINELKDTCKSYYENLDIREYWKLWQLNCLWAHSTFYKYEPLIEILKKPELNEANRLWIIDACKQMVIEEKDGEVKNKLQNVLNLFPEELNQRTEVKQSSNMT